jgi:lipopolysaccharide export system permease protein
VFLDHRAPWHLIARFYLFRAPEVVVQVLPVALLLATFLALGQLNKFGELTAMRSLGISLIRILRPVFLLASVATVFSLLLGEWVVPNANRERDRIYEEQIQRLRRDEVSERADVTYLGEGGRIFVVRLYLIGEKRMHEVSLQEFRSGQIVRRVDAAEASWDGRQWVFVSGYERRFRQGVETARSFERLPMPELAERPEDFAKESVKPTEMDYFALREYIVRLRASGARVANYLVDLHLKLALPLVNIVVILFGASIATRLRLQSAAIGFGLSVAIAFSYVALMRTGQALGHNGALPPYVAAWFGDVFFGALGAIMLTGAQRR